MASAGKKAPVRFLITGAAGQIGYSLIPLVASGAVLGPDQPVILHLLDIPPAQKVLQGVVMEIEDCNYPLVHGIVATTDVQEACKGVQYAILVGGFPRKEGMTRRDLLERNSKIFVEQGKALNDHADRNVKVLVVANPANTNCLVAIRNAPNLDPANFSCLTRLDHNRAASQLAKKLNVPFSAVKNPIIWGNHSSTMYPDASIAVYSDAEGKEHKVIEAIDAKWLQGEFLKTVAERGAAVISARGLSSAMSAAHAAAQHMRDWVLGTKPGEVVSMGIYTGAPDAAGTAPYGIARDIVYSFPVTCEGGKWKIVEGLTLDDFAKSALKKTEEELLSERKDALGL